MARRRTTKSALDGFLTTLVSRNSDVDGYWLFGLLVSDLHSLTIDLLGPEEPGNTSTPIAALIGLSRRRFREQLVKHRLSRAMIHEASLEISRAPAASGGVVNGHVVEGFDVVLSARVSTDLRATYSGSVTTFVAPHDARLELRSGRVDDEC